ncbi:uncharacterized protein LOC124287723 isoform X1 [Haliotis rubra]|uniref:uncharacterized protein LOC124287723 isoform X1 n=1 Tax=Haliotis rubra TaxID=36100 RepID=UPI001EE521AF|nr:uncharacterized protein LOC124287723 isoform X1 [Haliotis rubra]
MVKLIVVVLVLFVGACTAATSYKVNTNMTYVEFMTKSLMASKQADISKDKNKLTVMFEDLQQVNANGSTIANPTNSFAEAMFTFENATDESTAPTSRRLVGTANVFGGTLKVSIDVFTQEGNVPVDGENTTTVMSGDVRVMVEIKGLTFGDNADKLKLMLNIKGSESPEKSTPEGTNVVAYTLGDGGVVKLSKKVMKGTAYEPVTPMMSGNAFNFSLPKDPSVTYNFFLQPAKAENVDDGPNAAATVAPLLITWVVAIACKLLF